MEARGGSGVWVSFGFRFGEAATVELQPQALDEDGLVLGVRPSWSFVGIRRAEAVGAASHEPSRSPSSESPPVPVATSSHMPPVASRRSPPRVLLLRQGAPGWVSPLPADCLDVLPSETHLLLLRKSALESWSLDSAEGDAEPQPVWRRPLLPEEAVGAVLPLVPGGYVLPRPPFFEPLPPALRARSLALGHEHAVLLVTAGTVFAWGSGRHGQLGHGDLEGHAEPQPVEALQGLPQEQVAAGGWHSASISETGDLYVWGWNESGQLALPSKSAAEEEMLVPEASRGISEPNLEDRARPGRNPFRAAFISIQAFPALLDLPQEAEVSKISCGSRHTAAVTRAGDLYTWGWGKYGQLGHRDRVSSDRPKRVCYFVEHSLYVTEVVCGPWTTYVQAVDRKESDLP